MIIKLLVVLSVATLCSGCVATSYERSISVTKDADGKIVSTTETEKVIQPTGGGAVSSLPIKFHYMKDWWK
jgi:hypothetical protein